MKALKIIEEYKKNKKIKYSDLAKQLCVSKQCFYYHLENLKKGKITLSIEQIKKICDFLNENIENFFE